MGLAIYFMIGLFFASMTLAFDFEFWQFMLILFLWPLVAAILLVVGVILIPMSLGHWIGKKIKNLF